MRVGGGRWKTFVWGGIQSSGRLKMSLKHNYRFVVVMKNKVPRKNYVLNDVSDFHRGNYKISLRMQQYIEKIYSTKRRS